MAHQPVVKLFQPDGAATWLICSVDPNNPDEAFGLCDLGLGSPELGYVSLSKLSVLRGAIGLPVERDRYTDLDKPLKYYCQKAEIHRHIVC